MVMRRMGARTVEKTSCPRTTANAHATRPRAMVTCSPLMGVHACRQADEERQRIDREREQHPAEEAEANDVEKDADDKHGGGSRDNRFRDCAFHHPHGATGM